MWDIPGPGLKPVSPALAGGFLTTEPPGKSLFIIFYAKISGVLGFFVVVVVFGLFVFH